jgi:hypothetical protein
MARPNPKVSEEIKKALIPAMRNLAIYLDARFTEEISAVKWDYPTPPQVRDIVDTGRLRASQTRYENPETGSIQFTWPVEYAQQVHDGGVSTRTRQPFPGRPWTHLPMQEAPEKFGEYLTSELERK